MGFLVALLFLITLPSNILILSPIPLSLTLLNLFFKVFAISILIVTFLTDIKKGIIPDRITYPAITIASSYLLLSTIYKIILNYIFISKSSLGKFLLPPYSDYFIRHSLIIASPFYLGLLTALGLMIFFGGIIILTKGRGMGGGDLKLGIFLGLVLAFPNILVALMLAFISGSIIGIALLLMGKKQFGQTIPFGPFLTLGGIVAIYWGDKITNWYLSLHV